MLPILIFVTAQADFRGILKGVQDSAIIANRQGAAAPVNPQTPQIPQATPNPMPLEASTPLGQVPTSTKNSTETQETTPSTIPALPDPSPNTVDTKSNLINLPLVLGVTISAAGALFIAIYLILRRRKRITSSTFNKRDSGESMEGLTSAQLQTLETEMNYSEINNAYAKKKVLVDL